MSTVRRAASLAVRTYVPAAPSFAAMIAPRLELTDAGGCMFAQACMTLSTWRLLLKSADTLMAARALGGFAATIELPRSETAMADSDIPAAEGVQVICSEDGSPMLVFLDGDGRAYACAEFTPQMFSRLIGECCALLEVVSKGGLATLPCVGSS